MVLNEGTESRGSDGGRTGCRGVRVRTEWTDNHEDDGGRGVSPMPVVARSEIVSWMYIVRES